ncbi:MAG: ABC transporter substrate-binding protein [Eubacteriales bacterium]|nr:ABC transporter substrate-binding protein [Eubacteriales bacterium]
MLKTNKQYKLIFIMILLFSSFFLYSCQDVNGNDNVGQGEKGVVAKIDWTEYDTLISNIAKETDPTLRMQMMHRAEDIIMETGAQIPILNVINKTLIKPELSGVYITSTGLVNINQAYMPNKDILSMKIITEPSGLAFNLLSTEDTTFLCNATSALLTKIDKNVKTTPSAAKDIEISSDKLTYTFTLRDNLKWSNGEQIKASDYEYSFRFSAAEENAAEARDFFKYIDGYPNNLNIKSIDNENKLIIKLQYPCAYFLDIAAYPTCMPLYKNDIENAKGYKDENGKVIDPKAWGQTIERVYSGPYIISEWKHRESITLKKNPYYYDKDTVKTNQIDLMLTQDDAVIYDAYKNDDICFIKKVSSSILRDIKDSDELHSFPLLSINYMIFNVNSKIFEGLTMEEASTFRKALFYAIDREFIVNVALQGGAIPANTLVPSACLDGNGELFKKNSEYYTYPDNTNGELGYFPIKRDIEKTRQILKSLGYKFDKNNKLDTPITIEYLFNPSQINSLVAECIQQDLLELGIRIKPTSMEIAQFLSQRATGQFNLSRGGWNLDYDDPSSFLDINASKSPNNFAQYGK